MKTKAHPQLMEILHPITLKDRSAVHPNVLANQILQNNTNKI